MVVIDDFLEVTDCHRRAAELVNGGALLGRLGLGSEGLKKRLVGDVL